jgi:hypothetical protein
MAVGCKGDDAPVEETARAQSAGACIPAIVGRDAREAADAAKDAIGVPSLAIGVISATQAKLQAEFVAIGVGVYTTLGPGDFAVMGTDGEAASRVRIVRDGGVDELLERTAAYPQEREASEADIRDAEDALAELKVLCAQLPYEANDPRKTPLRPEDIEARLAIDELQPETVGLSCQVAISVAEQLRSRDDPAVAVFIASAAEFEANQACSGALTDVICVAYAPQSEPANERFLRDWLTEAGCHSTEMKVTLEDVLQEIRAARAGENE